MLAACTNPWGGGRAQGVQACAGLENTLEAVLSRVVFEDSRSHTHGAPPPPMASERLFSRAVQTGAPVHALINVLGTCLPKLTAEHPPPTEEQSAAATSGAPAHEPWESEPLRQGYHCPRAPAPPFTASNHVLRSAGSFLTLP